MTDETSLSGLKARFPGWNIRQMNDGYLIATRTRDLTREEIFSGLAMTLISGRYDTPMGELLGEQARIEAGEHR